MMQFHAEQQAALDLTVHCAVHANAGSGKTSVLTHRFLKILIETSTPMDQIVAITFTRASAAEMRERVHGRLVALLNRPEERSAFTTSLSDEVFCAHIRRWINEVGQSRISTFHSFCSSIIRQYAEELDLDGDVRDLEEAEAQGLSAEAVQDALRTALVPLSPFHNATLSLFDDVTIASAMEIITRLARSQNFVTDIVRRVDRDASVWLEDQERAVMSLLVDLAAELLEEAAKCLAPYRIYPKYDEAVLEMLGLRSQISEMVPADVLLRTQQVMGAWFTKEGEFRSVHNKATASVIDVRPKLDKNVVSIMKMLGSPWSPEREVRLYGLVQVLAQLGRSASESYAAKKRERNGLDFDDMIRMVIDLLGKPDIAPTIRSSIRFLMVDEFQDTDPEQYRLIELLVPALTDAALSGPNLFIVGDDKQSIYGFRDADVRLFRRATQAIRRANLAHGTDDGYRPLTRSYRMHQDLCTIVNGVCGQVFGSVAAPEPDDLLSYDVSYSPLAAGLTVPQFENIGTCSVVFSEDNEIETVANMIVQILNGSLKRDIAERDRATGEWVVRSARPDDIAVLLPKNDLVQEMANALRSHGVPFYMHGGRSFFSRPEVCDIRAVLNTCIDPSDDLATAIAMRSPLLRCSDAEITSAAITGRKSSLRDGLAQIVLGGEASPALAQAHSLFEQWTSQILSVPLPEFIRTVLYDTRWHETIATEPRREQILVNVEKVIDIVRETLEGTGAGIHDAIEALEPPDVDREREGNVVIESGAVQIMTTHAAKGLEFGIVILAGLGKGGRNPSTIFTDQLGFTFGLPGKVINLDDAWKLDGLPDVLSHELNKVLNARRDEAESRRRLYVALTRAKMHIVISFASLTPSIDGKGLDKAIANALFDSSLQLPHHVLAPSDEDLFYQGAPRTKIEVDFTLALATPPPVLVSPSALMLHREGDEHSVDDSALNTSGMVFGSAVHEALSSVIKRFTSLPSDFLSAEIVRVLSMHDLDRSVALDAVLEILALLNHPLITGHASQLALSRTETKLVGALGDIVFQGIIDVRMHTSDNVIEVWDWKTNRVSSEEHLASVATTYDIQMCTYAWLCMRAYPLCTSVVTRLVFTKAAAKGLNTIDYARTWQREDLPSMEERMKMAVQAVV